MSEQERYIPGVPCWVDATAPDPAAAAEFYGGLFGWELEDSMPADAPGSYLMARLDGGDVAAISSPMGDAPPRAGWNTYVRVAAADETAAKVWEAGGTVHKEPFDVFGAGRMAVCADLEGAVFCIWEAGRHRGAEVVNQHGALNFNELSSSDPEAAAEFYGAVFGWRLLGGEPGEHSMWALPGYGEFLESINPGTLARMAELNAPPGFENVVASLSPLGAGRAEARPHWGITFGADDADAIAARATELGGSVLLEPLDAPWVRTTVIADPQGASFTASQFVPENREA